MTSTGCNVPFPQKKADESNNVSETLLTSTVTTHGIMADPSPSAKDAVFVTITQKQAHKYHKVA